jgi:hypothetical protein
LADSLASDSLEFGTKEQDYSMSVGNDDPYPITFVHLVSNLLVTLGYSLEKVRHRFHFLPL